MDGFPWCLSEINETRCYGRFILHLWRKQVSDGERSVFLTRTDAVIFRAIAEAGEEGCTLNHIRTAHHDYFGGKAWAEEAYKADRVRISNLRRTLRPLNRNGKSIILSVRGKKACDTKFYLLMT